jgi:O-antigen ligase
MMAQIGIVARLKQIIIRPLATPSAVYRTLGKALGVLGLGALAIAVYLAPQLTTLGLIFLGLGLPILFLLWHRPEFGLLALIFLTSSFIPANIVDLRLPIGGGLDLRDLVLIGMFGVIGLRELSRGTLTIPWWPVGGPLLLFQIMAVFSAFYALVFEHVESNWVLNDLRILSLYTTFYITLWSIERPEQLKTVLIGSFIISDLTTVIIWLQQLLGADNLLLQAMTTSRDWRVYEQAGALRVIPAGQVLMHFMWFVALGLLLLARSSRRIRAFCVVQILFIGSGHLLSFTRAQWLALIVGLGLIFIILVARYKQHLAKAAVLVGCVALLSAGVIAGGSLSKVAVPPLAAAIIERAGSLLTPVETAQTTSLKWRDFEVEKALQAIAKRPLTGVGLGNRYRELTAFMKEASGWWTRGSIAAGEVSRFTRYVHNSYVSIAVKMGIPGLIAILWFYAAVLFKGFRVYLDIPVSKYKGVALGAWIGFTSLLVWCYFHAHLIKAESTPVIGLVAGLIGCISYLHRWGLLTEIQARRGELEC